MIMYSVNDSVKHYLDLCRISNLPTVWTNVLTAVVLSGKGFSWSDFLLLSLSMSLFYSGGMCLNDILDRTVDGIKKPFRPIPSGRISLRKAALFTTILFAAALGLLFLMPYKKAVLAGWLLLAVIAAYDIFHKAHPLAVLLIGGCRFMIFAVCSLALAGLLVPAAMIAGMFHFVYIMIVSVAARYENSMGKPFDFPVIPVMIAGISLLDGILMALFVSPAWILAGCAGALLTHYGQRFVKGD